jgi:hypothetical protein
MMARTANDTVQILMHDAYNEALLHLVEIGGFEGDYRKCSMILQIVKEEGKIPRSEIQSTLGHVIMKFGLPIQQKGKQRSVHKMILVVPVEEQLSKEMKEQQRVREEYEEHRRTEMQRLDERFPFILPSMREPSFNYNDMESVIEEPGPLDTNHSVIEIIRESEEEDVAQVLAEDDDVLEDSDAMQFKPRTSGRKRKISQRLIDIDGSSVETIT